MKEAFELIRKRIEEITVDRNIYGSITGCTMGICEDDDCLKCLKKKILSIVSEVEAEYENNVCEWKWGIDRAMVQCKGDYIIFESRRLFSFCPYCGKKIKVVE